MTRSSLDFISKISDMTGSPVVSLQALSGGGNSKMMKVTCVNKQTYALKRYAVFGQKTQERMKREISALRYLMKHHVQNIPHLISYDEDLHIAICSFIPGKKLIPGAMSKNDISVYVSFLSTLWDLKRHAPDETISIGPESWFSVEEIYSGLMQRYQMLDHIESPLEDISELNTFLSQNIYPLIQEMTSPSKRATYVHKGLMQAVPEQYWTYCPLDFGIHNSIQSSNGIYFVDFEHFGLADPAKIICDFLLHPKNTFSLTLKQYFFEKTLKTFSQDQTLRQRVLSYIPFYALQWSLILLNEFLPEHVARRSFASNSRQSYSVRLKKQIKKSHDMIKRYPHILEAIR